jgi:hypothetical protein
MRRANHKPNLAQQARLIVFDPMPHAFWYRFDLPESKEALTAQAGFLDRHLG